MMISREEVFEPEMKTSSALAGLAVIHELASLAIARYLTVCANEIRESFAIPTHRPRQPATVSANDILAVLLEHPFNYQSKTQVAALLPGIRAKIAAQMAQNLPLEFYFDYGGGYHASTRPDFSSPPGFEPGATELLLLFQIARFYHRISNIYEPGMKFWIVLDNAVAEYVNDIPVDLTTGYAHHFEALIAAFGAQHHVGILLQSRLGDFSARMRGVRVEPLNEIDAKSHHNVERFLGRHCTEGEARWRGGRYAAAGEMWERELRGMIAASNGIRLLQRASAEFLSFRPFPGGATRAQCGRIAFRILGERLTPVLATTTMHQAVQVVPVPVDWPAIVGARKPAVGAIEEEYA